mmetsp:Transcript_25047/g.24783  ORF Transcript_25047/g.24783 Transcript_25047/m.24783 type:complete len:182 (+) Transcript_25047:231-776(+)
MIVKTLTRERRALRSNFLKLLINTQRKETKPKAINKAEEILFKFIETHTDQTNYKLNIVFPEIEGDVKEKNDRRKLDKLKVKEALGYAYTYNGYFYLGIAQYELEKYKEASSNFEIASRFTPHNSEVNFYKGMSFLKDGKYDDCKAAFKKCIKYDNSNITAVSNLAYAYNISGHYDSAIKV